MAQSVDALAKAPSSIIDIRDGTALTPLTEQIRSGLTPEGPEGDGEKRLPTLLLYNEAGLKLFEKITYLDEYYLTRQEIEVLEQNADRIAERIALQPDSMLIELGSGYENPSRTTRRRSLHSSALRSCTSKLTRT